MLASKLHLEKFCYGRLHRRLLRRYRPQSAVNCSTLRERTAGSPPSTSQLSLRNQFGDPLMSRSTNSSGSLCYGCVDPRDAIESVSMLFEFQPEERHWAEAHIQIVKMTLTIKFNRNWSSFQLANRGSDRAFLHLDKKRSRAPEGSHSRA